ncbi:tyrosine-type recombinase/integrase, partial [Desulfobacula sp.]
MMANKIKWFREGSKSDGYIYFKKHDTRKNGVKFDKYFRTEYQTNGRRIAINFGWETQGWSVSKCQEKLKEYKANAKSGQGPISLSEERKIEADRLEAEQAKIIAEQEKIILEEKRNVLFSTFFNDTYLPNSKTEKKRESWRKESEHFKNWLNPELGHIPIRKITDFNLKKVKKNLLDDGKAPRTIQYCFATFRQVWNYARSSDIVNEDCPTRKVKLPKVENKRMRFLSHEESETLLSALRAKSQQVHDMTLLSLHLGLRAGELYSLTWGVIDFENGSALIRDAKGSPRHVYFTDAVKAVLDILYDGQGASDFVFKDRNGNQLAKISNTFFRTVDELGLNNNVTDSRNKVLFHTCRHTFASWHVQNGTDLYMVKELLG